MSTFFNKNPLTKWYDKKNTANVEDQILDNLLIYHPFAKKDKHFFSPTLNHIPNPSQLKDSEQATNLFIDTVINKQNILIVGDYDVDGITATALFDRFMKKIKYTQYELFIPNRFEHGYGLTIASVNKILEIKPNLVITVDNGITAKDSVEKLLENNIDVIITDHHTPIEGNIPNCCILNPKNNCSYPDKSISGAGVAFLFLILVRTSLRERGYWDSNIVEPNLAEDLDLVALGTIADQVPLEGLNRTFTYLGLKYINQRIFKKRYDSFFYLEAFAQKLNNPFIYAETIGFQLAPLLNAAGRMSEAIEAVDFLTAKNLETAQAGLTRLEHLNTLRKKKEKQMFKIAEQALINQPHQKGAVLFHKEFHEGIIGIVANKIADKYQIPTILLSNGKNNKLKGSCRSIQDIDILSLLSQCSSCLDGFGGHKAAAGCVLEEKKLDDFQQMFLNVCDQEIPTLKDKIYDADLELENWMITPKLHKHLQVLEPHGQGNQKPKFLLKNLQLPNPKVLAQKHLKWELNPNTEIIFWNGIEEQPTGNMWDILFTIQENYFRGFTKQQLVIQKAVDSCK